MPTSVTRRGSDPAAAAGFTLLELVVVLALLGLATAMVAPAGLRMIESWRRASEVDAALGTLSALGARARQQGRALRLEPGAVPATELPELPEGWSVVLATALKVQANGACAASHGELHGADGYVQPFELDAPFCDVRRVAAPVAE